MVAELAVKEGADATYTEILEDTAGTPIPDVNLSTLTLTLLGPDGAAINGRDNQNVLNINNVTIDGSGNLTWEIQPADNVIVGDRREGRHEVHRARFDFVYLGKTGRHWVNISVQKMPMDAV